MNPTSNETAGLQLPPVIEQQGPASNPAEHSPAVPEQIVPGGERGPAAQQVPQMAAPPMALPVIAPTDIPQTNSTTSSTSAASASSAIGDDDLIEKEWVNKAKQIVALNKDDPYKQSEELTVFRADYMKKHYDKNIKLSK